MSYAPGAPEPKPAWCGQSDQAKRMRAARDALDALDGPERVEVLRHYMGSAKKATPRRPEYVYVRCGCCDCCDCGAS